MRASLLLFAVGAVAFVPSRAPATRRPVRLFAAEDDEARADLLAALDEAERNEPIAKVLAQGELRFIGFLEEQIRQAQQRGDLVLDTDPLTSARFLMVVIEGIKTKYLQFPDWPWPEPQ